MHYISTRGYNTPTTFTDVLLQGLAPDGGLFMPANWPQLNDIPPESHYNHIALQVMAPYIGGTLPTDTIKKILHDTYSAKNFTTDDITPLRPIGPDMYLLELFHGPTLAFKDIALQFLARLFDAVLESNGQRITIIGATSGDTGSAAIEACRGRKHINIIILHPKGRTSDIQRRQMTSVIEPNVHNIAIEGTFDDCQTLVKKCFADSDLRQQKNLSAVNSINWARIMAQIVYYVEAAHELKATPAFAVPTGNFGNIFAAWAGKKMGANIGPLIIGSNRNDILTRFFETGVMALESVIPSYSPSMDIQISSNFERFLFSALDDDARQLSHLMNDLKDNGSYSLPAHIMMEAQQEFTALRCSDDDTIATIRGLYEATGIIIDPHTAVGLYALKNAGLDYDGPQVALACAHPAKFPDVVKKATGGTPELPAHLADLMDRPEKFTIMENDLEKLKAFVLAT